MNGLGKRIGEGNRLVLCDPRELQSDRLLPGSTHWMSPVAAIMGVRGRAVPEEKVGREDTKR